MRVKVVLVLDKMTAMLGIVVWLLHGAMLVGFFVSHISYINKLQ